MLWYISKSFYYYICPLLHAKTSMMFVCHKSTIPKVCHVGWKHMNGCYISNTPHTQEPTGHNLLDSHGASFVTACPIASFYKSSGCNKLQFLVHRGSYTMSWSNYPLSLSCWVKIYALFYIMFLISNNVIPPLKCWDLC